MNEVLRFFWPCPKTPPENALHLKRGGLDEPAERNDNEGFCPCPKKMLANSCGKR